MITSSPAVGDNKLLLHLFPDRHNLSKEEEEEGEPQSSAVWATTGGSHKRGLAPQLLGQTLSLTQPDEELLHKPFLRCVPSLPCRWLSLNTHHCPGHSSSLKVSAPTQLCWDLGSSNLPALRLFLTKKPEPKRKHFCKII